jgi:hypothetical protein
VDVNDLDHQRVRVIIRVTPLEHKRNVEGRGEMSKDGRLGVDTTSVPQRFCAPVSIRHTIIQRVPQRFCAPEFAHTFKKGEACDYMLKYSAAETVVGAESHRSTYRFQIYIYILPSVSSCACRGFAVRRVFEGVDTQTIDPSFICHTEHERLRIQFAE